MKPSEGFREESSVGPASDPSTHKAQKKNLQVKKVTKALR